MDPARRKATFDDLLVLPEDVRAEVIDGGVIVAPAALPRHLYALRALGQFVGGPFDGDDGRGGPGGWWILLDVDVRFAPHDVVRPDAVGWHRSRLPSPWDLRPIDVGPDWVCEIISPSNAAHDRVRKRRVYARSGVPFYWIADPVERTLEVWRLHGDAWLEVGSYDDAVIARIPPFEAIELEVGRLFAPTA